MARGHHVTRRRFARIGALGAAGLSLGGAMPASTDDAIAALRSRLLMELTLDVGGAEIAAPHRIRPVTGGVFRGARLRGFVLPGGGHWLIDRPDGAGELHLRATLQTDDHELVSLWSRGLVHTPDDGEPYVRTTPVFETASLKYGWLNRIVAVGVSRGASADASYRVYEIL